MEDIEGLEIEQENIEDYYYYYFIIIIITIIIKTLFTVVLYSMIVLIWNN